MRCRNPDRAAGVAAHPHGGEIGGYCGTGAAAGAAWIAVRRVWVAGLPKQRADRRDAAGELVHVRLRYNDRPHLSQLFDDRSIGGRYPSREQARAVSGLHADGLVVVLDDDRDAVQGPPQCVRPPLGIARIGFSKRVAVFDTDGVQRRSVLIICIDTCEIQRYQVA
jgi:hypothetical protein